MKVLIFKYSLPLSEVNTFDEQGVMSRYFRCFTLDLTLNIVKFLYLLTPNLTACSRHLLIFVLFVYCPVVMTVFKIR